MFDDPARYTREHAHYDEDLPFWREVAAELSGPVLDLGCATGRIAMPLARDGHEVWALDSSEGMLAQLRREAEAADAGAAARIHTVCADMASFALERSFGLILAGMNTLQTLLSPGDQLSCLAGVRRHLAAGGEFVFDVALPDVGDISSTIGVVRHMAEHFDEASGATLVHSAWYEHFDSIEQRLHFTIQVDEIAADGTVTRFLRRHEVHLYQPNELGHLLARAGLQAMHVAGDWEGTPVDPGSERQIYRCQAI